METTPPLAVLATAALLPLAGCGAPDGTGDPQADAETRDAAVALPPIAASGGEGTLVLGGTLPFQAGEEETYTFTYTVPAGGLDAGGGFLLVDPILHGVRLSKYADWVTDPSMCNDVYEEGATNHRYEGLMWAESSEGVDVVVVRPAHDSDIHQEMYSTVTVADAVTEGSTITLYVGMTEETPLGPATPECSTRAPYRSFAHVEWPAASRLHAAMSWAAMDEPPVMRIEAAPDLADVRVLVPSAAAVGEAVRARVVMLDEFGNPQPGVTGTFTMEADLDVDGLPDTVEIDPAFDGVIDLEITPLEPGVLRLAVTGAGGLDATSNPCMVSDGVPPVRIYWGDIHCHHGASHWTDDDPPLLVDENLEYARDVAGLDFAGESMKLPDLEVHWEQIWDDLQAACEQYESDRFVPLLGWEWMGGAGSGHHNAYLNRCRGEVVAAASIASLDDPQNGLWTLLDEMLAADPDLELVAIPHAPKDTGWGWVVDPVRDDLRPVAEAVSEWGEQVEPNGSQGILDGIMAGNRMGLMASSDNHDGFLGNPLAANFESGEPGGLAAVLAPELSREAIIETLQQRHSFAARVTRMVALAWADEAGHRATQGDRLVAFDPVVTFQVHATTALERVRILRLQPGVTGSYEVIGEWTYGAGERDEELTLDAGELGLVDGVEMAFLLHAEETGPGQVWTSPLYLVPDCGSDADDPAGLCGAADDDDTGDDDDTADDDTGDDDTDDDDSGEGGGAGCGCEGDGRGTDATLALATALGALMTIRRRRA